MAGPSSRPLHFLDSFKTKLARIAALVRRRYLNSVRTYAPTFALAYQFGPASVVAKN
jgi:hypothetical protein